MKLPPGLVPCGHTSPLLSAGAGLSVGAELSVGAGWSVGAGLSGGAGPSRRTWPRPAPIEGSSGHLPSSISDSLPSANWAGYEDTGAGAQFTEVTGSWVVPTVAENPYGDSSTWVGIDGIQSQGDLVQAGTDQSWSASGALYYAWYELLPQASVELGLVSPGDHITVKIDEVQTGTWTISVDDLTQDTNWTNSVSYSAPGTTAEWVEEAPTLSYDNSVETLADFGTVAFSNMAVEGPGTASATGSPIYMVNVEPHNCLRDPIRRRYRFI